MLRTFRIGGIHPPENKLSAGKKIEVLATPKQVIIPLGQHIGAPAVAVVKKGDMVKVGTLLAKAGGFVSANIHSSVSGKRIDKNGTCTACHNAFPFSYGAYNKTDEILYA